jgi:hypothetical protein
MQVEESKTAVKMDDAQLSELYPLDDIYCVEVLEQEVIRLTALIKKKRFDGENISDLQRLQMATVRKKEMLKAQIDNGVISIPQYIAALEGQIVSDMERARAYKARGDSAALGVVMQRMRTTKKEMTVIRASA